MRAAPIFQLDELARLRRALDATNGNLVCIYGRRRLGKSRLLTAALAERKASMEHQEEGLMPTRTR